MNRSIESYLEPLLQATSYESVHPDQDGIREMLANREAEIINQSLRDSWTGFESIIQTPADPIGNEPGQISKEAFNLIVAYETGGQDYYEKIYKSAPCWPGYSSGITIGFGFDLGYYSEGEFISVWSPHLGKNQIDRLKPAIGLKTADPGRDSKVYRAKSLIRQLADVKVPWSMGESVYLQYTVPTQLEKVYRYLPEVASLSADCCGALVSLVFNRGASFGKAGQRYREMRNIKSHLAKGDLERIPDELRSMKRLWTSKGLQTRRDEEASLFEQGLGARSKNILSDSDESFDSLTADEAFRETSATITGTSWRDVSWCRHDENQPDYRHIAGLGEGEAEFEYSAADLELLISANEFQPTAGENGEILFALRGCRLQRGESAVRQTHLPLVDLRPDHRGLRCVIGVYHRNEGVLSAFAGSTVPNSHFVWNYSVNRKAGNLLPTGCYRYVSGSHGDGNYPSSLLLSSKVVVLRTTEDLTYGTKDRWERGRFGNNIHPSHASYDWAEFSSAGGLTVRGTYDATEGSSGEWASFQKAAGIRQDGQAYDLVLLTGLEARIAGQLRGAGSVDIGDPLVVEQICRLRSGSQGERVMKLQEALGIGADGDFGSLTRAALVKKQQEENLDADSIFSCEMDDLLGFDVYPKVLPPVPAMTSIPAVDAATSQGSDKAPTAITHFPASSFESFGILPPDENDYFPEIFEKDEDESFESAGRVYWPSMDKNSPCYSHLIVDGADDMSELGNFEMGVREMELLIAANRFVPVGQDDVIAFGIRGAQLNYSQEKLEKVDHIPLRDARPDHRNFRCVMGYYFRSSGTFSAYTASTVPWYQYMTRGLKNNLLPTGCYIYKVGNHVSTNPSRTVKGLRLSDADGIWSGLATVLRTKTDNAFGLLDVWDKCNPSDNVHCAYSNSKFSSLGCQTVKGGKDYGLWNDFQKTLSSLGDNSRVDYVLLTGADVAIAAELIGEGEVAESAAVQQRLGRLRGGSQGEEVKRLQEGLGVSQTGYLGAETKFKLANYQDKNGHSRDGIFTPSLDKTLGWSIFASNEASLADDTGNVAPVVGTSVATSVVEPEVVPLAEPLPVEAPVPPAAEPAPTEPEIGPAVGPPVVADPVPPIAEPEPVSPIAEPVSTEPVIPEIPPAPIAAPAVVPQEEPDPSSPFPVAPAVDLPPDQIPTPPTIAPPPTAAPLTGDAPTGPIPPPLPPPTMKPELPEGDAEVDTDDSGYC